LTGTITNEGTAVVDGSLPGTGTFYNTAGATLAKTTGSGIDQFNWQLDNQGDLTVDSGELEFTGGGIDELGGEDPDPVNCPYAPNPWGGSITATGDASVGFSAGCYDLGGSTQVSGNLLVNGGELAIDGLQASGGPSGGGNITVNGGYLNVLDPSVTSSVAGLDLTGGTMEGPGEIDICTSLVWSGGTMTGTGTTGICPGATGQIDPSEQLTLNQRTLNNQGTLMWSSGAIAESSAASFENYGTFNASSTTGSFSCGTSDGTTGGSLIVNASVIGDPGTAQPTDIECPIINIGQITAPPSLLPLPNLLNSTAGEEGTDGAPIETSPCGEAPPLGGAAQMPDDEVLPIVEALVREPDNPSGDAAALADYTYTYPNPNTGEPGDPSIVVIGETQNRVNDYASNMGYSVFSPPSDGSSFGEELARDAAWMRGAMEDPNVEIQDIGPDEARQSYSWGAILEEALATARGYRTSQVDIPPAPPDDCS
jgi:hypothetical protein